MGNIWLGDRREEWSDGDDGEYLEMLLEFDAAVGRVEEVGRWSGVVASTTRAKHCFMCRTFAAGSVAQL